MSSDDDKIFSSGEDSTESDSCDNFLPSFLPTEPGYSEGGPSCSGSQEQDAPDEKFCEQVNLFLEGDVSNVNYEEIIKERGVGRSVPPAVQALIGQANMSFVRGNHEETFRLCKEAIRIAPYASEPYRTLSELLEERGDHIRALHLGVLAEELGCKDAQHFMTLGDKAMDLELTKVASHCYWQAARYDPTMPLAHTMKIRCIEELGDRRNLHIAYKIAVEKLTEEHGATILQLARSGAAHLHKEKDIHGALSLMETAFNKAGNFVQLDHVNLIVELYMSLQIHEKALEVICRFCDVEIVAEEQLVKTEGSDVVSSGAFVVLSVKVKSPILAELRSKLLCILIALKAFHLTKELIEPLLDQIEEYGDLVFDIAEALASNDQHSDAINLYKLLTQTSSMNLPQVWLQYGESLRAAGRSEEAVEAYLEVMEKAPHLAEPRLIISELLNSLGRSDEAISALSQDPNRALDVGLLFERCLLLKDNPERILEFLATGRLLMSRHCSCIRNDKEVTMLTKLGGANRRLEAMKKIQDSDAEELMYVEGKRMPTPEEEWSIFLALCDVAFKTKQTALLQRLTFSALTSRVLCRTVENEKELTALAILSSYFNNDHHRVYNLLRPRLINEDEFCPRNWILFNISALSGDDVRHHRFIVRSVSKRPAHLALPILFANNCFMAGSYKQALNEYMLQYQNNKSALLSLLISATFAQLSFQKSIPNPNALVTQAQAFMSEYAKLREKVCQQEMDYNLGRLNHFMNLLPQALYHYHRVLETPPVSPRLDLTKEAAYNISIIYQNSKSYDLARHYIQKYIVI